MREYGFSLTLILPFIVNFVLIREYTVSENPYSRIFYPVDTFFRLEKTSSIKRIRYLRRDVKPKQLLLLSPMQMYIFNSSLC